MVSEQQQPRTATGIEGMEGTGPTKALFFSAFVNGGDRPHESLIFQCFRDIDLATTPIFSHLASFSPVGGSFPKFIFNSFFFLRNLV